MSKQSWWKRYFCCFWKKKEDQSPDQMLRKEENQPVIDVKKSVAPTVNTSEKSAKACQLDKDREASSVEKDSQIKPQAEKDLSVSGFNKKPQIFEEELAQPIKTSDIQPVLENSEEKMDRANCLAIILPYQRNQENEEDAAYAYFTLSCIEIQERNPDYEQHARAALKIYQRSETLYLEEIITLKNNVAFAKSRERDEKAIQLYSEVLNLQNKYFSIHDERRLATINNLFVLYCTLNKMTEAKNLYEEKRPDFAESQNMKAMLERNHRQYFGVK